MDLTTMQRRYLTTIQGALYKAQPPFGIYGSRLEALQELQTQLHILNSAADADGPYIAVYSGICRV